MVHLPTILARRGFSAGSVSDRGDGGDVFPPQPVRCGIARAATRSTTQRFIPGPSPSPNAPAQRPGPPSAIVRRKTVIGPGLQRLVRRALVLGPATRVG